MRKLVAIRNDLDTRPSLAGRVRVVRATRPLGTNEVEIPVEGIRAIGARRAAREAARLAALLPHRPLNACLPGASALAHLDCDRGADVDGLPVLFASEHEEVAHGAFLDLTLDAREPRAEPVDDLHETAAVGPLAVDENAIVARGGEPIAVGLLSPAILSDEMVVRVLVVG